MTDDDRAARLARLRDFAAQQRSAEHDADRGSLDRAGDVMALYEDRGWVAEMDPPKQRRGRGRPTDPESFSRFTKWLAERVPLNGRYYYRLRDAYEVTTDYLAQGQISPTGERAIRPLKWMRKNGYSERIPEVWKIACDLAGSRSPDEPTVRKALSKWKHDNVPKTEATGTPRKRGGKALVDHWFNEAEKIMQEYPELFADALERVEQEAERRLVEHEHEMATA